MALRLALCSVRLADAQQAGKVHRIGLLMSASSTATVPLIDALRQGFGGLSAGHSTHFDFLAELLAFAGAYSTRREVMSFEGQSSVVPQVNIEHIT
jgi:hypothetical protein